MTETHSVRLLDHSHQNPVCFCFVLPLPNLGYSLAEGHYILGEYQERRCNF